MQTPFKVGAHRMCLIAFEFEWLVFVSHIWFDVCNGNHIDFIAMEIHCHQFIFDTMHSIAIETNRPMV